MASISSISTHAAWASWRACPSSSIAARRSVWARARSLVSAISSWRFLATSSAASRAFCCASRAFALASLPFKSASRKLLRAAANVGIRQTIGQFRRAFSDARERGPQRCLGLPDAGPDVPMMKRELGLQPATRPVKLKDVGRRSTCCSRARAGSRKTRRSLPICDWRRSTMTWCGAVSEPMSSFSEPRAARADRRGSAEASMSSRPCCCGPRDETADPRVGLGRQELGKVVDFWRRKTGSHSRARRQAIRGLRPGRSRRRPGQVDFR